VISSWRTTNLVKVPSTVAGQELAAQDLADGAFVDELCQPPMPSAERG
jgi:hypothetical protein